VTRFSSLGDGEQPAVGASSKRASSLGLAVSLLTIVIFICDLVFPLGIAAGVPYVAVVLLTLLGRSQRLILVTAITVSVLATVGFFIPPPEGPMIFIGLGNRLIALFAIWVTAILSMLLISRNESIRRERDFNQSLIDTASSIILVLDNEGRVMHFNSFTTEATGYKLEEVLGKRWLDVVTPPGESLPRAKLFSGEQNRASDPIPLVTKNGEIRQFTWTSHTLISDTEEPMGMLYVGQDITSLVAAQDKVVQSERLAAIGQALAAMTHEARNELHAFNLALTLLDHKHVDEPTRQLLGRLRNVESRLSRLFDDVRGFAAPIKLERAVRSVEEIWRKVWKSLESKHGVQRQLVERIDGVDLACFVDPMRIEQLFRNLMENSLAACQPPVVITITCDDAPAAEGVFLRISFQDNGPGLPDQVRQRIFEPFFTTKSQGTGLGMPICRRIIDAHGGDLTIGSSEQGAEFVILLPRANQQTGITSAANAVGAELRPNPQATRF